MNKKLRNMYKEIVDQVNLKENIPAFLKLMADNYYSAAVVRLATHYFTYYEIYCDDNHLWDNQMLQLFGQFNRIVSRINLKEINSDEYNEHLKELEELRNSIMARMNCLTSYARLFEIYEYALNRVEYRFKEMEQLNPDEEIANKIINFIFETDDNFIVNESIKEAIGQLPVRITRQKYFEYLREGFNEIIEKSEESFDSCLKMVRSSAMLDFPEESRDFYPELWEKKAYLENLDFKDITEEEYKTASGYISDAGNFLAEETKSYGYMTELTDYLYAVLVCASYRDEKSPREMEQEQAAFSIINEINKEYFKDKKEEVPLNVIENFKVLEGLYEEYEVDLMKLGDALDYIDNNYRDLADNVEGGLFNKLLLMRDIFSDNLFADFDKYKRKEASDKGKYQESINKLVEDLSNKFKFSDRMIVRAIMANTLNKVPVFFNNSSEIMDYIIYSLNQCTDLAEKYASIELLNQIMDYQ